MLAVAGVIALGLNASAATQNPPSSITVPMRDMRGIAPDTVRTATAIVSNDCQAVILFGDIESDANAKATFAALNAALKDVIRSKGTAFRGLVVSDPLPAFQVGKYAMKSRTTIQFYSDGQLTSTIEYADGGVANDVKETLREDYERVIKARGLTCKSPA